MRKSVLVVVAALVAAGVSGCGDDDGTSMTGDAGARTPVYDTCFETAECVAEATSCSEITIMYESHDVTDAICTISCTMDAECPGGGFCGDVGTGGARICFERCTDDTPCPAGFSCLSMVGTTMLPAQICIPF